MSPYPTQTQAKNCQPHDDKINVVIENAQLSDVENTLVSQGWGRPKIAADQYLCDPSVCSSFPCIQDLQLRKTGPRRYQRFHVRLWFRHLSNDIIGAAHHETLSITLRHEVSSWESGKLELAEDFKGSGWKVASDDIYLSNAQTNPYSNGYAMRVVR